MTTFTCCGGGDVWMSGNSECWHTTASTGTPVTTSASIYPDNTHPLRLACTQAATGLVALTNVTHCVQPWMRH